VITYTKHMTGSAVFSYGGTDGVYCDGDDYGCSKEYTCDRSVERNISKDEFLKFVAEHHDEVAVQFAEAWIASREPKSLDCVINGVEFRFNAADSGNRVYLECGATFSFRIGDQQKIVDVLTENIRRAGEGK
jgi:hypothetical protein